MKVQQMLNATPVLEKLMTCKLPVKKAYEVYSLAKQIKEQKEFFINEEKKLIDKFNAEVTPEGYINFKNVEDQVQFSNEHKSLLEFEVESLNIIEFSFADLDGIEFTPSEFVLLEGVVDFKD